MTDRKIRVNPGYVFGQLEKALAASLSGNDEQVRARASEKVERWKSVIAGMLDASLDVGSRTPVKDVPAWATLEVVHGGFATGGLLAGGPLDAYEEALRNRIDGVEHDGDDRTAINLYFLGEAGRQQLLEMLRSGRYRIDVPEQGALPVAAWLLDEGEADRAAELIDGIAPFFDRLRFYPTPDERPLAASTVVRLQTVGETAKQIEATGQAAEIERMYGALGVWLPLYDRAVSLFLETVDGDPPSLRTSDDGVPVRDARGAPIVQGDWPCQHYREGWREDARSAWMEFRNRLAGEDRCGTPRRSIRQFFSFLEKCIEDPAGLTGRDVGKIRSVLASFAAKYGVPGSERHARLRAEQAAIVARPLHGALRRVIIARLGDHPTESGLESVDPIMAAVTADEARVHDVPGGAAMPPHFSGKLNRCLELPVAELVARGVVPSGEVMARLLPQISSQVRAIGLSDPGLRALYSAIYTAFRRRRSLLLLDLQHQVRLEELPWVSAIEAFRRDDKTGRGTADQILEQMVVLTVASFPQTILPNKLIQEFGSFAQAAGRKLPFTDELAADIFMGDFSEKFVQASKVAARMLGGSLYARYYGVPVDRILKIDDVTKMSRYAAPTSAEFTSLCLERSRIGKRDTWSVAQNGKIIEQQQILTTHNLAVLFDAFDLKDKLGVPLIEPAMRCFEWICQRQRMKVVEWKAQLQAVKNCAYAWRQMVFFLSHADASDVARFVASATNHLRSDSPEVRRRLSPALNGLSFIVQGGEFDSEGCAPGGGRQFLGWATGRHWMLGEKKSVGREGQTD